MEGFRVSRVAAEGVYKFLEIFAGLENVPGLTRLLGSGRELEAFLERVVIRLSPSVGYMHVDDTRCQLVVGKKYLETADDRTLYLDVIHELIHIRQLLDGRELYDERFSYVDGPTEVEVYRLAVKEARQIGMTEKEIGQYLHVEWVNEKEHDRLLKRSGIRISDQPRKPLNFE